MALETFIKGIEVLDKTEIKAVPLCMIILASVVGLFVGIVIMHFADGSAYEILAPISCIFVAGVIYAFAAQPTGEYEYKVTIDDAVSLTEFMAKYDITDQEGKIYTIRLKDKEE